MTGRAYFPTRQSMDDLFKASELNRRKAEAAERENDKKSRVEYHAR